MKLPISWLKEYVDTDLSAEIIAEQLTMAGLEVEEILGGHDFTGVVVGLVLSVEDHPNADKLHVAKIDTGSEELQIVCGAGNLRAGQKVPVALIGAKLGDFEIGKAKLRGIESSGMICSERELGISDEHEGIMVLASDTKIGSDVSNLLGQEKVLDVKVLANRPDCMSMIGLANEVAVTSQAKLQLPQIKLSEVNGKIDFTVKVEDANLCPRYMARFVTNLKAAESPEWMKARLIACGVRPTSLFVDISNYVMLEFGQPLHFFDLDKLQDKTIIVRSAKKGEKIATLDGVERQLSSDNLVISDNHLPIALAGVMGGADTEIDNHTTSILIEAAIFDKASIRRTSRSLGLRSEAVARFEKGIAQMLPEVAINRAAQLLQELGHGEVSKQVIDTQKSAPKPKSIIFDNTKMNAFLGTNIPENDSVRVLTSLGFSVTGKKNVYDVVTPYWRTDIQEAVDVYEEVIRIVGYDIIPYTLPHHVDSVPEPNEYYQMASRIRERLASIGFTEILTYSFIGAKELGAVSIDARIAPKVQNPLVSDQEYLRPTLAPKMLEAICDNQYHADRLCLFEIGRSFESTARGELPKETNWLTLGLNTDYFDAKGTVYNLLTSFHINEGDIVLKRTATSFLKQGIGADLFVHGKKLVTIGEVQESVKTSFDIRKNVAIAQINLDVLLALNLPEVKFVPFSKYQMVTRDTSVIFESDITIAEILQKLTRVSKLVQKMKVIDIYVGKGLTSGQRSITLRFFIQSEEHTLTDTEVDEVMSVIYEKITEIGGRTRVGSKA